MHEVNNLSQLCTILTENGHIQLSEFYRNKDFAAVKTLLQDDQRYEQLMAFGYSPDYKLMLRVIANAEFYLLFKDFILMDALNADGHLLVNGLISHLCLYRDVKRPQEESNEALFDEPEWLQVKPLDCYGRNYFFNEHLELRPKLFAKLLDQRDFSYVLQKDLTGKGIVEYYVENGCATLLSVLLAHDKDATVKELVPLIRQGKLNVERMIDIMYSRHRDLFIQTKDSKRGEPLDTSDNRGDDFGFLFQNYFDWPMDVKLTPEYIMKWIMIMIGNGCNEQALTDTLAIIKKLQPTQFQECLNTYGSAMVIQLYHLHHDTPVLRAMLSVMTPLQKQTVKAQSPEKLQSILTTKYKIV
jgi:hypothetical protein